ncbi:MAG: hypothetical protein IT365_01930 [Candidatus Hydrogenedentes bacterium]|nr:hypothetical protein [Candidatus Hydrogenedentota bacterium]
MREKTQKAAGGPDVLDAIRNAYPENIVTDDVVFDEDSYYDGIRDDMRAALSRIGEADLVYDRPPEGRPHWEEGDDPDEDPPTWVEDPSSYDLLFPEEDIRALRDLRARIASVLKGFGIHVLTEQELGVPVPGLKPDPAQNAILGDKHVTVGNALFFQKV